MIECKHCFTIQIAGYEYGIRCGHFRQEWQLSVLKYQYNVPSWIMRQVIDWNIIISGDWSKFIIHMWHKWISLEGQTQIKCKYPTVRHTHTNQSERKYANVICSRMCKWSFTKATFYHIIKHKIWWSYRECTPLLLQNYRK